MKSTVPVVAGIDIGATNTVMGLVDRHGQCYHRDTIRTGNYETATHFLDAMARMVLFAMESAGQGFQLEGVGIGAPNGNYYLGTIEAAANLQWKEVIPVTETMAHYFDVPVRLTNDANAAAMGEMLFGAAQGMKDFIMITLGTGLGSGIVCNGKLVYGHDGFAGELGHVIVEANGRQCGCGRRGCLETYASASGISRTMQELLTTSQENSLLRNQSKGSPDAKHIYDAACAGDKLALRAFDLTSRYLGTALANAVAFSSPQAIILFGGLAQAGEFILEPVKRYMEDTMLHIYKNKVSILPSMLPESDAAILGAAALIWEEKHIPEQHP
ncbi:MAG TPA: ROK family protein [Bacteroidales bacterium]|nr:ROK family protein [Bacteroidales bacterium]HSA44177.1 ROK family protein [Bacteroidales bacterium]